MGKAGDSAEDGVSDREGVVTEAKGAVVWLATSKERWGAAFSALLATDVNHHMHTRKNNNNNSKKKKQQHNKTDQN